MTSEPKFRPGQKAPYSAASIRFWGLVAVGKEPR